MNGAEDSAKTNRKKYVFNKQKIIVHSVWIDKKYLPPTTDDKKRVPKDPLKFFT